MIVCRPPLDEELRYIESAWIRSYEKSPWSGTIASHLFRDAYLPTVRYLMAREKSATLVAISPAAPEVILGFACVETGFERTTRPCLHYCYVKPTYRKMGVAKELLRASGIQERHWHYSFETSVTLALAGKFGRLGITYAPNLAIRPGTRGKGAVEDCPGP